MYSRNNSTWLKHWDFILLDLVMFQIAYICSYVIRMGIQNPYGDPTYLNIGGIICLIDLCAVFFTEPYHGIMRRGYFLEFKSRPVHAPACPPHRPPRTASTLSRASFPGTSPTFDSTSFAKA